jgi:hypothetical protein
LLALVGRVDCWKVAALIGVSCQLPRMRECWSDDPERECYESNN